MYGVDTRVIRMRVVVRYRDECNHTSAMTVLLHLTIQSR